MCDTETGKITETESEVDSVDDGAFKKNTKITEQEAVNIALKAHPGAVHEVEVNAANGKIIGTYSDPPEIFELWERF